MLDVLTDPQAWLAFVVLSALEIVLGIDNLIFISILVGRLPAERQKAARTTGLALAMLTRVALLFGIVWLTRLYESFFLIVGQIALIDIVFSLDSVLTAVGLANDIIVMVAAIVLAIGVMMWVAGWIGAFIERHPTIKMLALAFLILIGVALVAEGLHFDIPKGYLYFSMAFAVLVELINLRLRALIDRKR